MKLNQYLADNTAQFNIDYLSAPLDQKIKWFDSLKQCARYDLSLAHCIQHNHTARLTIEISTSTTFRQALQHNTYSNYIGTSSVIKQKDSCGIVDSSLVGSKYFVSNLDQSSFHTLWVPVENKIAVVALFDRVSGVTHDRSYQPLGMEDTCTGNLHFDQVKDYEILYYTNNPEYATRYWFHNYAFCTINLGLCEALLKDLQDMCTQKKLNLDYTAKQICQSVAVYYNFWRENQIVLDLTYHDKENAQKLQNLYSYGKKVLAEILNLFLLAGDSRHTTMGTSSQRFRDALTYVTHRQNYYNSLDNPF